VTGRRPSGKGAWTLDDSKKVQRQMLTVVGGVYAVEAPSPTSVDAAIYWNTKSEGTEGNCSVLAFNGERGPVDGLVWSAMVEAGDCGNVNLESDLSNVAISIDGGVVAATSHSGTSGNVTIAVFDGQAAVDAVHRPHGAR
jgi:hypothetical protein